MLASELTNTNLNGIYRVARTGEVFAIKDYIIGEQSVLIQGTTAAEPQGRAIQLRRDDVLDTIA